MRTGYVQAGFLRVTTPFGKDDLLLDAVDGSEGISELFAFRLRMRSTRSDLAAAQIVGKPVGVALRYAGDRVRYLHGIVRSFVRSGLDVDFMTYEADLVPRLWLLTLSRNRRIYQGQSVTQILGQVLREFGVEHRLEVSGELPVLDYCVQYDETAFDFVSRLMEQAGLFYCFRFEEGVHRLVVGDGASVFVECPGLPGLRFHPGGRGLEQVDAVTSLACESVLELGEASVADYDFLQPSVALSDSKDAGTGSGQDYAFGVGAASPAAAQALAALRLDAARAHVEVARGESAAFQLCAGQRFSLTGHFVPAANRPWVLRRLRFSATREGYTNEFEAFPAATTFRALVRTPWPRVPGCETARVVGPQGEEIWTDQWGRVKVQFPWDREAAGDDTSSTWLRVAQPLAGNGFGAMFLPRVGQEVVVTYVNGDPDRPLVTGCVYNADNLPPAKLPDLQTQTILRSRSVKQGQAGNELRFEDRKDAEELYLHAQKDMRVAVENNLSTSVMKGNEVHQVKGTRNVAVTGEESHSNAANLRHTVQGDYEIKVDGNLSFDVGGDLTITCGGSVLIKSSANMTHKAGAKLLAQGGAQIDLKAPVINSKADATQTVQAGAMLTLKGALTKVN